MPKQLKKPTNWTVSVSWEKPLDCYVHVLTLVAPLCLEESNDWYHGIQCLG